VQEQPVVIVGAGLGGLAAAIHLAAAGRRVVVCEKNERVGGKLNSVAEHGYTFDIGPSLLTMPWVLRDTLAAAGLRLEDELDLAALDPICRYRWPDGAHFDMAASLASLLAEIERLEPRDVAGFLRFFAYTAGIYEAALGPFLLQPFEGLRALLRPAVLASSLTIDPLRSVDAAVRSFFRSPHLRQVFNRYATYNGSSPYRAPATFNIIPYVELAQGAWYVRGGLYTIARALERAAVRLGVEIRTSAPVTRIVLRGRQAAAVALANGDILAASSVVVNADPRYAYRALIEGARRAAASVERLELSSSGFVMLLGLSRTYPQLAHHNIFFSTDYPREFAAIFDLGVPAPDPTIYVNLTSPIDPQHAPAGHTNMFVLVNAPAHTGRIAWQREAPGYGDLLVRKLERMGLSDLSAHIAYQRIITPSDFEQLYNAPGGAIYGMASNTPWAAFLRPPLRAPGLRGLYFVGGGTHPGGGIPLVLLSGRAVSQRVLADTCVAIGRRSLH
jgi:phytoene desaturase